jgi:hypothetical protein
MLGTLTTGAGTTRYLLPCRSVAVAVCAVSCQQARYTIKALLRDIRMIINLSRNCR